ncbi:hypothetical protein ACE38W_00855 [Chitinophaga sp. Hz27]|uniref:hypothetical protein n=1 Tax=Chitinophaga sp. Hz27 TaxID=3347169 RepID=UPI0035D5434F
MTKKIATPIIAAMASLMLFIGTTAFTNNPIKHKKTVTTTTTKKSRATMYTFYYNGSSFTVNDVQNPTKWTYTSNSSLCDGTDEQACRIQVPATYVDNPTTAPTLKSTVNIQAALNSSTSTAYVVSTAAGASGVISNSLH